MTGLLQIPGLLRKEWREHRFLVISLILLAPLVSAAVKVLGTGFEAESAIYLTFGLPVLASAFCVGVAADLVAAESAAGRHGFTAALPTRPGVVWTAKVTFLFGTTAVFLFWLVLIEAGFLAAAYGPEPLLAWLPKYGWLLVAAPVLGSATLFWSTLMDRGFTAAFGACFLLAPMAVVLLTVTHRFGLEANLPVAFPRVAIFVALPFLGGSFAAFVYGRIHLGCRFRRITLATAVLIGLLVPAGATSLLRLERWVDLRPGDPDLMTHELETEPSGDWDFVMVSRTGTGPLGAPGGKRGPHALFAVNRTNGTARNLSAYGTPLHASRDGEAPGHVRLLRHDRLPDSNATIALVTDYDLEAGEPVSTRPLRKTDTHTAEGSTR